MNNETRFKPTISTNATILGNGKVYGTTEGKVNKAVNLKPTISMNATVYGDAQVYGKAVVTGHGIGQGIGKGAISSPSRLRMKLRLYKALELVEFILYVVVLWSIVIAGFLIPAILLKVI